MTIWWLSNVITIICLQYIDYRTISVRYISQPSHDSPNGTPAEKTPQVLHARRRVARPLEWPWKQARKKKPDMLRGFWEWFGVTNCLRCLFLKYPQIMIAQLLMSIDEHLFALWTLSLEQDDMRITVCHIHKWMLATVALDRWYKLIMNEIRNDPVVLSHIISCLIHFNIYNIYIIYI